MATSVDRVMREVEALTPEELATLMRLLREYAKKREVIVRPKWRSARGTAKAADDVDAQEWVSQERAEAERNHGTQA